MNNEKELLENLVAAKKELDSASQQFADGAITAIELQTWAINFIAEIHNLIHFYEFERMRKEMN